MFLPHRGVSSPQGDPVFGVLRSTVLSGMASRVLRLRRVVDPSWQLGTWQGPGNFSGELFLHVVWSQMSALSLDLLFPLL